MKPCNSTWIRTAGLAAMTAALAVSWSAVHAEPAKRVLSVCSVPDNLPFSNERAEGFENKIAEVLADAMHAQLRYTFSEQRRGFFRRTLQAKKCDVVMGVPAGLTGVDTTRPYYVSGYVFVSPKGAQAPAGFDDPALRRMKVGLEAIGLEGANTPPAMALARRGLGESVVGFTKIDGAEAGGSRASVMIDAVAKHDIDMAITWGPFGGYFAKRHPGELVITPIASDPKQPGVPFSYPIAMAVREGDAQLLADLQDALDRSQAKIQAILQDYGVPLLPATLAMTDDRKHEQ